MRFSRTHEWLYTKTSLLLGFFFFFAYNQEMDIGNFMVNGLVLGASYLALSFWGYWVNDCFDVKSDELAGKKNDAAGFDPFWRFVIGVWGVCLGILPWFFAVGVDRGRLVMALFAQILLLLFYSVPPIRLKERAHLAVLADALYGYVLPVYITQVASGGNSFGIGHAFLYLGLTALGIRNFLLHLIDDLPNDILSQTKTLAVKWGQIAVLQICHRLVSLEIMAILVGLTWIKPILGVFLPLFYLLFSMVIQKIGVEKSSKTAKLWLFNGFYEKWLGLAFLISLIFVDLRYILLIWPFFYVFREPFSQLKKRFFKTEQRNT